MNTSASLLETQEVPGDDKNLHFSQTSEVIREIWFCKSPNIPYYSHFPFFFFNLTLSWGQDFFCKPYSLVLYTSKTALVVYGLSL